MAQFRFLKQLLLFAAIGNLLLIQPSHALDPALCRLRVNQVLQAMFGEPADKEIAVELAKPGKFHALNTPEFLEALQKKGKVSFRISPFGSVKGLEKICSTDLDSCFVIVQRKTKLFGKSHYVFKGADGRWFEAPISFPFFSTANRISVDFSKFKYLPAVKENFDTSIPFIKKLYHREFFDEKNAQELGDYLTSKQLATSTNFKAAVDEGRKKFAQGIQEANRTLSSRLIEGKAIEKETLERINLLANDGINPYNNPEKANLAGVMRGTKREVPNAAGELKEVDLSKYEVYQGGGDHSHLNQFLPASQVPEAIDRWLERVNRITPHTDPEEVFALYKELVDIHPFPDANGRTSRMMLNYMLLKAEMVPLEFPAHSLYFRPEDILRKYTQSLKKEIETLQALPSARVGGDFYTLRSFSNIKSMDELAENIQKEFGMEHVKLEHLHGTSGYIFVGTYKGRFIQFESTQFGEDLSDSLGNMISRGVKAIDEQEVLSKALEARRPTYAIYPELLEQKTNYHLLYEEDYLNKEFLLTHQRPPNAKEASAIGKEAQKRYQNIMNSANHAQSDRDFLNAVMRTPKHFNQAKDVKEVTNRILEIAHPEFKDRIRKIMVESSSPEMKQSYVDIYNAFNSPKFDDFITDISMEALNLCRKAKVCGPNQRIGIPDQFLAQVMKIHADEIGVPVETISRFVGREPGRLYIQRIQRGSLIIDDGAPGNHGMMPHALQNLFIYQQLGKVRTQSFFKELKGWVYERMFDSNTAFAYVPTTRDITRRNYWTGVFKAGNRSDVSKFGELVGEEGRYPGFLRENKLDLVSVEEKTKNLLNDGSVIRARYKGKEFSFEVDKDGAPLPSAEGVVHQVKQEMDVPETLPE